MSRYLRSTLHGLVILGTISCAPAAQMTSAPGSSPLSATIDSVAARVFTLGAAPGVGIVVVRDTQIIFAKGYGFADVEAGRRFTENTEFYIASTTKSFTGLTAAILDLQGVMKLDAPISRYLPTMKLRAPMSGDSITVRSLLTHTHGIGNGPVAIRLAYTGEYQGDDELIQLLSEHVANPRGRAYSYTNLGYNIVGLAMDKVTGESWKATLKRLIFDPLGMSHTSAYVTGRAEERLAMPYLLTPTGFARTYYGKTDANMQSAGGLITTPLDMGRWLEAHINEGRLDGRQVLPAAAIAESHKILAPMEGSARGVRQLGYGLGWQISLLGTDTLLNHGGGFTGFATYMSFMPQHHIGVAVMANNGEIGGPFAELMAYAIYDVLRGHPAITNDSIAAIRQQLTRMRAQQAAAVAQRATRPQNLPFPLEAYTGRFHNPALGHMELRLADGKLEARMGATRSPVEVYDNTKNQLRVELFGSGEVVTVNMKDGRADSLTFEGLTFSRVP